MLFARLRTNIHPRHRHELIILFYKCNDRLIILPDQIYNGVSSSDAETNNFLEIGCRDNAILRFDEIIENDYSNFRGISDFIPIIHQEIIVICQIDLDGIGIAHP